MNGIEVDIGQVIRLAARQDDWPVIAVKHKQPAHADDSLELAGVDANVFRSNLKFLGDTISECLSQVDVC